MKTSTEINSAVNVVGFEKAVEITAKAGFDGWDFSLFKMMDENYPFMGADYLKFARKLRRIGEDYGIKCNQSHAPFPSIDPAIRSTFKRAIECTAEAGGEICVIHPCNDLGPKENAEMFNEILPFAKECGVKIATENMFNYDTVLQHRCFASCNSPEDFNANLDAVNDDFFVACLDLGHAEIVEDYISAPKMIYALGKRLKALHIHDNDKFFDYHQLPFTMSMDFEAIAKALAEVDYDGWYTLESCSFPETYMAQHSDVAPEKAVFDAFCIMAETAKKFEKMVLEYK